MIDIHCHILPGLDDGARNLSDSLEMARKAVEEGIDTIIATPHYINNRYHNPKQTILAKVEEVNEALRAENIALKIVAGQEPRIDGDLLTGIDKGEIITLAGTSYIFIEFPSSHVPRYTEQLFYDLQMNGLVPVIVHPERNQEIIQRPDRLYQLVEKGALTQLTASSVCGDLGKKIKTFSSQLIEYNLTHFIASDAHNVTTRSFKLREAYQVIAATFGTDSELMLKENAELLVAGQNVYKEIPEPIKKKRFFTIF